jgi:hypothetical protein
MNCDAVESLVVRPQLCSCRQLDRGEQMSVYISDPAPEQRSTLDEMKDLHVCRDTGMGQVRQRLQHYFALTQVAQSKLADDKGVRQNHSGV